MYRTVYQRIECICLILMFATYFIFNHTITDKLFYQTDGAVYMRGEYDPRYVYKTLAILIRPMNCRQTLF